MAKYLVETYYTCSIKVSHYLDDINESELRGEHWLGVILFPSLAEKVVRDDQVWTQQDSVI